LEEINLKNLSKALNGKIFGTNSSIIKPEAVSIDSRDFLTNKIFIPLKGSRDGHDFLKQAEETAMFAISEKETTLPHIRVKDTSKALKDFAKFYKSLFDLKTIGITGSVGKTTTKDITHSILSEKFETVKTIGNYNNEIGLPLTVFNINNKTEAIVLEMGMNNLGEIHNLADIARPDIAIITNIGTAHIENLGSRENILKAKTEILDYNPKKIILDGDNDMLATLRGKVDAIYYFVEKETEKYSAYNIKNLGLLGTKVTFKIENVKFDVTIPIPGIHVVRNALASSICAFYLGVSLSQIIKGIQSFKLSKDRMDIKNGINDCIIINDTYNASPQSIIAMLDLLVSQKNENRNKKIIAILGDMFELGDFSKNLHEEIGRYKSIEELDSLITIGKDSKFIHNIAKVKIDCHHFNTKQDFFTSKIAKKFKDSIILVKASRGMMLEEIVQNLL